MSGLDVTAVAESLGESFARWAALYVLEELIAAGAPWLGWPLVSAFAEAAIAAVIATLVKSGVMRALFETTVIRKAEQASYYMAAVAELGRASPAELADAQRKEMLAFSNFVRVG